MIQRVRILAVNVLKYLGGQGLNLVGQIGVDGQASLVIEEVSIDELLSYRNVLAPLNR